MEQCEELLGHAVRCRYSPQRGTFNDDMYHLFGIGNRKSCKGIKKNIEGKRKKWNKDVALRQRTVSYVGSMKVI